jgi:3'-phosphoadenosine 5'-phosphosulfate (PAPS) 3'-phosphatase
VGAAALDRGASEGGPRGRHWILDPIDGTKGFVAGRQYAVALALMDRGDVALGVLGCPNMPWAPVPRTAVEIPTARPGVLFAAHRDSGCVVAPLDRLDPLANVVTTAEPFERRVDPDDAVFPNASDAETPAAAGKNRPRFVRARRTVRGADACYMESWGDSVVADHGGTARLAAALRITRAPVRIDSMAKYGALARGDADVYLRFPPASYREKVWDHAAGVAVVRAAGGVVTDGAGNELDFARGRFLEIEDGIVGAATEELHAELLKAIREGKATDEGA